VRAASQLPTPSTMRSASAACFVKAARSARKSRSRDPCWGDGRRKIRRTSLVPEGITRQALATACDERVRRRHQVPDADGEMRKITDVDLRRHRQLVAEEFGIRSGGSSEDDVEEGFIGDEDSLRDLQQRAPISTIMEPCDHGKTSAARTPSATQCRQPRGRRIPPAYRRLSGGDAPRNKITFVDNTGTRPHRSMRQRGAKVTDIVVGGGADRNGVKPQRPKPSNHAKAAGVQMIVRQHKIDTQGADPQRGPTECSERKSWVESLGRRTR